MAPGTRNGRGGLGLEPTTGGMAMADDRKTRTEPEKPQPQGGADGVASNLQPGGTIPGGGPGASQGSLGTGGAQTGGG
jgi:hypothetical protein